MIVDGIAERFVAASHRGINRRTVIHGKFHFPVRGTADDHISFPRGEKAVHAQTLHSVLAPQCIPARGRTREGCGGEKAARKSASLPVPIIHQTSHRPSIAAQQSLRSASGEVEQKREWLFPQKSGKSRSRFCGSFSSCRPTVAESDSDPYAAPAPCRTQGVRGAADTPPATHDPATPEKTKDTPPATHDPATVSHKDAGGEVGG